MPHSTRRRLPALAALLAMLAVPGAWGDGAQAQSRQETLIIARNIDDYVTNDPGRTYEYTSQMLDQSSYDTLVTVEGTTSRRARGPTS
jgi:hypothetical protein